MNLSCVSETKINSINTTLLSVVSLSCPSPTNSWHLELVVAGKEVHQQLVAAVVCTSVTEHCSCLKRRWPWVKLTLLPLRMLHFPWIKTGFWGLLMSISFIPMLTRLMADGQAASLNPAPSGAPTPVPCKLAVRLLSPQLAWMRDRKWSLLQLWLLSIRSRTNHVGWTILQLIYSSGGLFGLTGTGDRLHYSDLAYLLSQHKSCDRSCWIVFPLFLGCKSSALQEK